jgi:hypothetical protein
VNDFFSSDAGKYASAAKQFLDGALTLLDAQGKEFQTLRRPTLALAGHGLELMLKACICWNGEKPKTSGKMGHDIPSMWSSAICRLVRDQVFANAKFVANEARLDQYLYGVPDDTEVLPLIEEYVLALAKLHAGGGHPLRYPADPAKEGPFNPFLVKSLWRTADDFVKRPNDFKLLPTP